MSLENRLVDSYMTWDSSRETCWLMSKTRATFTCVLLVLFYGFIPVLYWMREEVRVCHHQQKSSVWIWGRKSCVQLRNQDSNAKYKIIDFGWSPVEIFFFIEKKIKFFAHCVKSDIIVQDMPNCFKRAKEEQIDFHLIFYTDWFSCKKTWIWLLMFYARLVSQQ